jgi:chromosome partitioning protein
LAELNGLIQKFIDRASKNLKNLGTSEVPLIAEPSMADSYETWDEIRDLLIWDMAAAESAKDDSGTEPKNLAPQTTPEPNQRAQRTIAVLSGKGGVGKTSTLLGLAGVFLEQGKKVLFVDLDPQGSLSTAVLDDDSVLTVKAAFADKTLVEIAVPAAWKEFKGLVSIVTANRSLKHLDNGVDPTTFTSQVVKNLGDLSVFDVVLIDAPASLGILTAEAIALASEVVVVAEPTLFSLRSAADAVEFAQQVKKPKPGWSRNLRVMLNKLDSSEEALYRAHEIKLLLPNLVLASTVSLSAVINEANSAGLPVQALDGESAKSAGAEFAAVLDELAGN